ncbi:MAG: efflux RND transporter periplasmic adaptor subunit [Bacteroidia bacterium]|nr:efflux RND transporter periplasmic adaptor subunit [Bacteroidia bacterium]
MNKKIYLFGALIIVIAVLIAIGKSKNTGILVNIAKPTITTITESIPCNGKIQPVTEVKISPDVSGEIVQLDIESGDTIRKGDLLLRIKPDIYISNKERAEATLNSSKAQYLQQKAQLAQSELNHKRNTVLYNQKAISDADYEKSLTELEIAQKQLQAAEYSIKGAEAALNEAIENLSKTSIYAPMNGVVSRLDVELGERVVGTSQMAGTEMLRIADMDDMEVIVDVNENDIIRINKNNTAVIEIDAYPNRKFSGVVTKVASSSKSSSTTSIDQVTNFEVNVSIDRDSYKDLFQMNPIPIRPGMSASVTIITNVKENILTIPIMAITTRNNLIDSLVNSTTIPEQVFVYDSTTNMVNARLIKTGIQDMTNIEVVSGLNNNEQIVVGPYSAISKELINNINVTVQ